MRLKLDWRKASLRIGPLVVYWEFDRFDDVRKVKQICQS